MLFFCMVAAGSAAAQVEVDDARAHYSRAVDLYKKGDHDAAIAEYREALRLKPDDPEARSSLNELLAKKAAR
jgi:Flp pilus assembly protein TadD